MFCPRKYGVEVLTLYLVDCCECCTEFLNIDIDTFYSFPLKYNILRKTLLGYAFMAYAFNTLGIFVNSTESSPPKMWRIGYLVQCPPTSNGENSFDVKIEELCVASLPSQDAVHPTLNL